jgi:hypothetical protein
MKWAHLLCAMWIPEVSLGNVTFQEPVQDVEKVPKTRWKLVSLGLSRYDLVLLLTTFTVLLHLQAKNGSLYPVWSQIVF